jgi:hypothetical protein
MKALRITLGHLNSSSATENQIPLNPPFPKGEVFIHLLHKLNLYLHFTQWVFLGGDCNQFKSMSIDGFVKSWKAASCVIPAKAPINTGSSTGIQYIEIVTEHLDSEGCPDPYPGFTGLTTFCEAINIEVQNNES